MICHNNPKPKKTRLASIECDVNKISRIVDEDRGYPVTVQQISAVRSALECGTGMMVQGLLEYNVSKTNDSVRKEIAIEIKYSVTKFYRLRFFLIETE